MNKSGVTGIIAILIGVLVVIGFLAFVIEDIPSFMEDVTSKQCLPITKKLDLCVSNSSGVALYGELDRDLDIILNLHGERLDCAVGKDYLNVRTVCKDEFGYIYNKNGFTFEIHADDSLLKTITQAQLQSKLVRALAKPDRIAKSFGADAEGLFALRGLIEIAENWNSSSSRGLNTS